MIGLTRDFAKLTKLLGRTGPTHAMGIALLAIRARLMRRADHAWERSKGLAFNESDVGLDTLHIASPNKRHGFSYVPCNGIAVRALLDNIKTDFSQFCFIDFGAGEGRSVVVASTYPFQQAIGVEFAQELHEAAVRNFQKADPAAAKSHRLQSVHMDAAQFEIPRTNCVLYFYNPFGEAVFRQVLLNIERVYRECQPKFYVIFYQTRSSLEIDNTKIAELLRAAPFPFRLTRSLPI
jgi:hypothetical protein